MVATDKEIKSAQRARAAKGRQQAARWEDRLKRMGLDLDKGRPTWLSYGHEVSKLDTDGCKTYVSTDGEIEDLTEWPLSLM